MQRGIRICAPTPRRCVCTSSNWAVKLLVAVQGYARFRGDVRGRRAFRLGGAGDQSCPLGIRVREAGAHRDADQPDRARADHSARLAAGRLAEQAQQIGGLGKELYQRLIRLGERVQDIGRKIGATVKSYNEFVGTLETSVLPQARKFSELQGVEGPETLEPVEAALRPLAGRDLSLSPPADAA
nr:DNA recombination protein RmuC [Hankyongella ginsenosidimutans]